jgi:hypothetical protein
MKRFTTLWFEAPRWARGLFLGNLCYLVIVGIGFTLMEHSYLDQKWLAVVSAPFLWPTMGSPIQPDALIYHSVWCALGALLVQIFGEVKGITILIALIYATGIAVIIYALTHLSISF